jgi:hypothetical protein
VTANAPEESASYKNNRTTTELGFDRVYSSDVDQETLFDSIGKPMVLDLLKSFDSRYMQS